MANTITRSGPTNDTNWGIYDQYHIWVEGYKYSGTASNNSSTTALTCTALSGAVEENVKIAGIVQNTVGTWAATTAYLEGQVVQALAGSATYYHVCVNDGTSGGSEPAWSTNTKGTTADGTVTWRTVDKPNLRMYWGVSSIYRHYLLDNTKDFRANSASGMVQVNTTDNAIVGTSIRGGWWTDMMWGMSNGSVNAVLAGEGAEIHGFEKTLAEVTDFMKVYQGNLIYIDGGTGVGQVRKIKSVWDDGTDAHLIVYTAFTIAPDSTSTFKICWSPMDIIYQSDASGWNAGDLVFTLDGHKCTMVRMKDHIIEIGNSGVATYFGWAGYVWSWELNYGDTYGYGLPGVTYNAECKRFLGEGDYGNETTDTPAMKGQQAFSCGGATSAWAANWASNEAGADGMVSGARRFYGGASDGGGYSHGLWGITAGSYWSWHNGPFTRNAPATYNSVGDYLEWAGGNWAGGMSLGGESFNITVTNLTGSYAQPSADTWTFSAGFGWLGGNTGSAVDYWRIFINANCGYVAQAKDAAGRDCDFWKIDHDFGTYNFNWAAKKTVNITAIDAQKKTGISGVTVEIKNQRGDIVSETDSGSSITATMTAATTSITIDLLENLTTGDLVRIDNEYITLGTVSGTGAGTITGCTREARYPKTFFAKIHTLNAADQDNKIYVIGSVTTDADGKIPQQKLYAYVMVSRDGEGGQEVTVDGTNYTCTTAHQATAGTKPPHANWSASGSQGFKWEDGKYYHNVGTYPSATNANRSYNNHVPYTIKMTKSGYETNESLSTPNLDSTGVIKSVELATRRYEKGEIQD